MRSLGRAKHEIVKRLQESFGDKATVTLDASGDKITLAIKPGAGFKREEHRLTPEQINEGVCGGGITQAIDGMTFEIEVKQLK